MPNFGHSYDTDQTELHSCSLTRLVSTFEPGGKTRCTHKGNWRRHGINKTSLAAAWHG